MLMWRMMILGLSLSVASCAQFPALEGTVPADLENADFPNLVPLEPVLDTARAAPEQNAQTEAALQARVAALKARAARLRGRVVDSSTRARMRNGVTPG